MKFPEIFLGLSAAVLLSSAAMADTFAVTYGAAGAEGPNVSALCAGAVTCVVGTQKFASSFSGTTNYGTSGVITGVYTGDYSLHGADQYGAAHAVGDYIVTFSNAGYTITLGHDGTVPGVNYFGFWLSALDRGNELQVLRGGNVVGTYSPADLRAAVNNQPSYFGNPDSTYAGRDSGEPFAFVNFFDLSGYFDQVHIFESPYAGGYESDNHTVGYINPIHAVGNAIPEPATLSLLGLGVVGGLVARRFRRS